MIYTAVSSDAAERALDAFAAKWDVAYPTISQVWRRNWARIIPFFAFPMRFAK